jgi:putative ABC transport system permease protein
VIPILRNMARRRVRTGLTVFGIAIGVFALTVMGAMSENFASLLDGAERLSSRTIQIQQATKSVDDRIDRTTVSHLKQVDGVRDVVITIGGSLSDGQNDVSFGPPNEAYGIDPAYIPDVFGSIALQAGRWIEPTDFRATTIGSKIASGLHLGVGSTLVWRKNEYTVVGIMGDTNTFPDNYAVMPVETVRHDLKFPPTFLGSVSVIPDPGLDPEELASRINDQVAKVRARSPKQFVAEIRQSLAVFNIIMLGGAVLAGIVGGLAVVNTMIMSVNERTREIGIKKALGAEDGTIIREFLTEAALMGLIGGIAGAWFGWVAATLLNVVLAGSLGGSDVWLVTPRLIGLVMGFALGLGIFAGIYPAWSAARLDPVQALRAE